MVSSAHVDSFARDNLPPRAQWPEFVFDLPELQYSDRLNCATELLDKAAEGPWADRTAVQAPLNGGRYVATYRDLRALANRIANVLTQDLGLVPGNRVLLRAPNNPMLAACFFAVWKAGGIVVPTMRLLRAKELGQVLDKAKVDFALCDCRLGEEMEIGGQSCGSLKRILHFGDGGPASGGRTESIAAPSVA